MGIALLILLLALVLGGVGLFVEALRWVLIIAVVLLIASAFTGYRGRARTGRPCQIRTAVLLYALSIMLLSDGQ